MTFIDPTYLRNIYDGLMLGSVHKEKIAALPIGLIGVYEDALPSASNVNERMKFLNFFSIWASLKTEVSSGFVASLLEGWTEDQVTNYIAQNSKWFNSPVSGKYILYHQRLRTFVLQKASQSRLEKCNEGIIQQCQLALRFKVGDEWERYALEFLSAHLLFKTMYFKGGEALKTLAYDTAHWNRQIEISRSFEWTKRMLNDTMLWASKYDDEEVIECALYKVDLYHLEQNDASRIVELVRLNDMDTVLQRLESFGGNGEEGLKRKFTLYFLCMFELTFFAIENLDRRCNLERLIKHFDEQLPIDVNILNWNNFLPNNLVFSLAVEWSNLGLDSSVIYKRTKTFDGFIKKMNKPLTELQISEFIRSIDFFQDIGQKCQLIIDLSSQLIKKKKLKIAQNYLLQALDYADGISEVLVKSTILKSISAKLMDLNMLVESQITLENALALATTGSDNLEKSRLLNEISMEWAKHGALKKAAYIIDEAISVARNIKDEGDKCIAMKEISHLLKTLDKLDQSSVILKEAFSIADSLSTSFIKGGVKVQLAAELAFNGSFEAALNYARSISIDSYLGSDFHLAIALRRVASELKALGRFDEAVSVVLESLECALEIGEPYLRCSALIEVSGELVVIGKLKEAIFANEEAIASANMISADNLKSNALKVITNELVRQGKLEQAVAIAMAIPEGSAKSSALKNIAAVYSLQGNLLSAISVIRKGLEVEISPVENDQKNNILELIASEFAKQGEIDKSLTCTRFISDIHIKRISLLKISCQLFKCGNVDSAKLVMLETLACAQSIINVGLKSVALLDISFELAKFANTDWSTSIMREALDCAQNINDEVIKSFALKDISLVLAKQGKLEEAHRCAQDISIVFFKALTLIGISAELTKQKRFFDAEVFLLSGIEHSRQISIEIDKSFANKEIAIELARQGKFIEAQNWIKKITVDSEACLALRYMSLELASQNKLEEARVIIQSIRGERDRSVAQWGLAIEYVKLNDWKTAEILGDLIISGDLRLKFWMSIAETAMEYLTSLEALYKYKEFKSTEAQEFYLKGWVKYVKFIDLDSVIMNVVLNIIKFDFDSMDTILKKHFQREIFFSNMRNEKIDRVNNSLNIEWLSNIRFQF